VTKVLRRVRGLRFTTASASLSLGFRRYSRLQRALPTSQRRRSTCDSGKLDWIPRGCIASGVRHWIALQCISLWTTAPIAFTED